MCVRVCVPPQCDGYRADFRCAEIRSGHHRTSATNNGFRTHTLSVSLTPLVTEWTFFCFLNQNWMNLICTYIACWVHRGPTYFHRVDNKANKMTIRLIYLNFLVRCYFCKKNWSDSKNGKKLHVQKKQINCLRFNFKSFCNASTHFPLTITTLFD